MQKRTKPPGELYYNLDFCKIIPNSLKKTCKARQWILDIYIKKTNKSTPKTRNLIKS